jgi:hypothetical protein
MYNQALPGAVTMTDREMIVTAAPYNFSTNSIRKFAGKFVWSINGGSVTSTNNSTEKLLIRSPDGVKGTSQVSVRIESGVKLLQTATAKTTISFNNEQ